MIHINMRIIARRTLKAFVDDRTGHRDHSALKASLDAWFDEVSKAEWINTADVSGAMRRQVSSRRTGWCSTSKETATGWWSL